KQLLTGGDVVSAPHVRRVLEELRIPVTACYGPTESTLFASCYRMTDASQVGTSVPIGTPIGNTRLYVLDTHLRPVPVGVPGELFISGDGLARGYLGRPELTAERFLRDPFSPEAGARMYRTGDLVRRRADGVLEFLGRADTQVKIRGFRIELPEVEAALLKHPALHQAVVVAREDHGLKRLVAYVVGEASVAELRAHLKERLPEYMIPGAFVRLESLPLTANGKVDRKALPADSQQPEASSAYEAPRNATEQTLVDIWSKVLGRARVGIRDNFFELGGDSIVSLQVVARARQAGLQLSPRQLFQHQTVEALAAVTRQAPSDLGDQGLVQGPVPLTPVQHAFFEASPLPNPFNQAVLLQVNAPLDTAVLEAALRRLVEHHDALRMKYAPQPEGGWRQHASGLEAPLHLVRVDLASVPEAQQAQALEAEATRLQASLSLDEGLLLRAAHFALGAGRPARLLLVAHHLAVDTVSWRVLLEDLESLCTQLRSGQTPALPAKSTSFKAWAEKLQQHAHSEALTPELDYWLNDARAQVRPLPVDRTSGPNTFASSRTLGLSLDADETRTLLREVPAAYRARVEDVLLSALAQSLRRWTGHGSVLVELEGHGREDLFEGVDLSRTVGWFTATYPVLFQLPASSSPGDALRAVRDGLRRLPAKGLGYGLLRHLTTDDAAARLRALPRPQVSFNYLGQIDAAPGSSTFALANEPVGASVAPGHERSYPLEVGGLVRGGELHLSITYSTHLHERATVEALAQGLLSNLRALIAGRTSEDARRFTPADFPLAALEPESLDGLLQRLGPDLEDLYPLSPMQQGMLFHALLVPDSAVYFVQSSFLLQGHFDPQRFQRAWEQVVANNPVLRTRFVWEGLTEPLQVVQSRASLPWLQHDWRHLDAQQQQAHLDAFLAEDRARGFDLASPPLMRLAILRLGDTSWQLVWSQHHLLLDGWSVGLLLQDLFSTYDALLHSQPPRLQSRPLYRDYIAWLRQPSRPSAESFWRETLQGFHAPTPLPGASSSAPASGPRAMGRRSLALPAASTAAIQDFARRHQLTLNTLLQASWALLLGRYAGESDVLFGATTAARPAELPSSQAMMGLFINSLPVRVQLDAHQPVLSWLRQLQERQSTQSAYEHTPLVQVQSWSQLPRGASLFDSLLVFENYPIESSLRQRSGALQVLDVQAFNHTNYPLTAIVSPGPRLALTLSYEEARFSAETIDRLMGHWQVLLDGLLAHASGQLGQVPMLTAAERHQVLSAWNDTAAPRPDALLPQLIADQAARSPHTPAVMFEDSSLTFHELDTRANQLAWHLRSLGVGPDV
ncbi:condensation domain-containing protein, partial [Pyxidicoccus sp. 3LFB2]